MNRSIFLQLNINAIWNEFNLLVTIVNTNIDNFFLFSETKIDSCFPTAQFHIEGYTTPYRLDRDIHGGGMPLCMREDIPSSLLNSDVSIEGFFAELNL